MKVLIVGSGSREHALAWHFRKDPRVGELFFAPGNAGTASLGTNLPWTATDLQALTDWARRERPALTFVGPEAPLCAGIVDAFNEAGLPIFGPNRSAARLEASKVFTKDLLLKHQIPTGQGRAFTEASEAYAYSATQPLPQVIKADGLAAGKGVVIAQTLSEARQAIENMMEKRVFGDAGAQILIEECLVGQEVSLLVVTDGQSFHVLPAAQDHKRLRDGDQGPNTGGMGAYAPAPFYTPDLAAEISDRILRPTLQAFLAEGLDFQGVLFVGLMLTTEGAKVLEFNVRLGDPETQVVLPLLKTPLLDIAEAVRTRRLHELSFEYHPGSAVGVVLAAPQYPESPRLGDPICGLDEVSSLPKTVIFHGGTATRDRQVVTAGGRVLTVTAWAEQLGEARDRAYQAAAQIKFSGSQFRRDIGSRSLASSWV